MQDGQQSACQACLPGTMPAANQSACQACLGTNYSTLGITCAICEAPKVVNADHTTCS
eukprot:COSAG06_NODE_50412_length_319_cov_0.409091_2_plen_57_part_01